MATSYTSLLGLALPVQGELQGVWGDTVNNSITSLLDTAIAGTTTLSTDADVTLSTTTGASNQARQAILLCSGARTAQRTITAPAQSKIYTVINATTGGFAVKLVGVGPTTGVTISAGTSAVVAWNGSDFIFTAVSGSSGVLPVANGGTGLSSGTSGGVLYYSASGTLASSAALAASALVIGGGAGAAPATTTTGTGVVTALGVNVGTAGAFVVNGGALGTPSSGTVTNLTGTASININGTVGATTPATGTFTTLSSTGNTTLGDAAGDSLTVNAGTITMPNISGANRVPYFDGSSNLVTNAGLAFNGTATLTVGSWAITPAGAGTAVTLSFPVSTTYTFPNLASATLATTGTLTQTFSGTTTFSGTFTQSGATGTFGSSTAAGTYALGSGATTNGTTRTINIGTAGVAGSIVNVNIGSSASTSGTTTLQSAVTAINSPSVTTNQATVALLNATATTINFGGDATTMAIGASGTSTVTFGHQIVATTSARSPLMIGGTGTTSTLTLRATSGTAANGAAVIVQADSGVEAFRTDYLGTVLLGATARIGALATTFPKLQVHGVAASDSSFSQTRWSADATGPLLFLGKSRGATVGTRGAVSSGDALGTIFWTGDDGTNSEVAARILVTASGTVSTGIVPGQMAFYTTDATGVNIVSAYINNAQQFVVSASSTLGVGPLSTASTLAVTGTSAKQVEVSTTLNNANDSELHFMKARGGTSLATIVSGDDLGTIVWKGYDGATHDTSATILVSSSGTISSGVVQSSMAFRNADTAGTLRNTLVIDRNGMTSVGTATRTRDALSTTAPALFYTGTSTITDGTTAASGTVTHGAIVAFDNPAIAATNASVTYTNASTVYIDGAPTASTNVTITNAFSLFVNSGEARFGGAIRSSGATNGIGYATGAGGTVTQITSKATGVTLNKACGQITMDASALNANTTVSFVLTNSAIAAGDQLILNHISGGTPGSYLLNARSAAGSATLDVRNVSAGSLSEAIVISFSVIKAVTA